MKVRLVKPVDPAEYGATLSGLVAAGTGVVGTLVEGYRTPAGKVAVEFWPPDIGYSARDKHDRIIAYIPKTHLENIDGDQS